MSAPSSSRGGRNLLKRRKAEEDEELLDLPGDAAVVAHAAHQAMAAAAMQTGGGLVGVDGKPVMPPQPQPPVQQTLPMQHPHGPPPQGGKSPANLGFFPGKLAAIPNMNMGAAAALGEKGADDDDAVDNDEVEGAERRTSISGEDGGGCGSLDHISPYDVLNQCQTVHSHLLSQLPGDVPPSSTVLRRALRAVEACMRQAELRVLRDRIRSCLPPGSLTELGDDLATSKIDSEIERIEKVFNDMAYFSEQRCIKEGVSTSLADRYNGENGLGADPFAVGTDGAEPGDKATLPARLRDAQFPRRYRAREFNRHGSIFRELRLTSTATIRHQPTRGEKARNCALCKERETLYECRDCRVPLCTSQIRGFKDTCMAKWHEAVDLTEEERARAGTVKEKKKAGKEERKRKKKEEEEGRDGPGVSGDGEVDDDDIDGDGGSGDGDDSATGQNSWDRFQQQAYQLKHV